MEGWIKLHRKIVNNWLYPDKENRQFTAFEAWIDLIVMSNHTPAKALVSGVLVDVGRGCRATSSLKLSQRWGWSRGKVVNFIRKLENDGMVKTQSKTNKGIVLEVVNYGYYQSGLWNTISVEDYESHKLYNNKLNSREMSAKCHQNDNAVTLKCHQKDINNNELNDLNEKNEQNEKGADGGRACGSFLNLKLTDSQISGLEASFGKDRANRYIEKLSAYMASTGKSYHNHFATLKLWLSDDMAEQNRSGLSGPSYQKQKPAPINYTPDSNRDYDSFESVENEYLMRKYRERGEVNG